MEKTFLPLFAGPVIVCSKKSVVQTARKKTTIDAPGSLMRELVTLCDGMHSIDQIVLSLGKTWENLLERFSVKGWSLLTVPLYLSDKYGGNGDLSIIRAIVPGMVPMTFGYRQEPAAMERIYTIAQKYGKSSLSYGELTKFPHPFA